MSIEQIPGNFESEKEIIPEENKGLSTGEKILKYGRVTLAALAIGSAMPSESKAGTLDDTRANAEQSLNELDAEKKLSDIRDKKEAAAAASKKNEKPGQQNKIKKSEIPNVAVAPKTEGRKFSAYSSGPEDYMGGKNLLKDNLVEILREKKVKNIPLIKSAIEQRARDLFHKSNTANELVNSGNYQESENLKAEIKKIKVMMEKTYGPIFKE